MTTKLVEESGVSPGTSIFGRFLGLTLLVTAALLLLGHGLTERWAGTGALTAMYAGCAVGAAASLAGTVPVLRARKRSHVDALSAAMVAMGVRLGIALGLGIALAMSGVFPTRPLLLWVVVSHAGLLVPDTLLSIKVLAQQALMEN